MVPDATQVADPFHVVKLANSKLDECRRRVQNETLGHRGRKSDPLYRCRRLLTMADERLDEHGRVQAPRPVARRRPEGRGDDRLAREGSGPRALRPHRSSPRPRVRRPARRRHVRPRNPTEVRSLGRTLRRWKRQIAAWHGAHVSNGPTEAANNLIKRVKRAAFGFTSFRNYRVRSLLYAGSPMGIARDDHTPLKSEAPDNRLALLDRDHPISSVQPRAWSGGRVALAVMPMWAIWVLAYLIGFAHASWFPAYRQSARALSVIADQQLATGVMWTLSAAVFLPVIFSNFINFLSDDDDVADQLRRSVGRMTRPRVPAGSDTHPASTLLGSRRSKELS